jgi:hypothetical protein
MVYIVEKSSASNNMIRMVVGEKKYTHVLPEEFRIIVDKMIEPFI